ncbi:Tll0287-like domain-containing protein [Acetobacter sp.]|jgi:protein-histidine pros-kinase|uniref:Tll0287-like domain-containing protein n=1 Tax=Acetobacter sp. TaxID=440 RepID=UPI0025C2D72D|nr:DUF3365 domain-containing protein [Acetobacter sp.]MCH4092643.1 DUF3365 domain-containing protein [Acetobacter sp.]MCI1299777.1 DUF3365 domain-containing protein [Acetobacter sp.]MCI1315343.1 DUF3365 domain-containing protein [Acetobacter sp.]
MTFRLKLNLVLVGGYLVALAILFPILRGALSDGAADAVREQATMLSEVGLATEHYTSQEVLPQLLQGATVQFPPQSVPFYAVSRLGEMLQKKNPDMDIRVTALNPTNPSDAPTLAERDLIERLRTASAPSSLLAEGRNDKGQPVLRLATPVRVTDSGCLSCHSDPGVAPKTMIDAYGSQHGFGWKPNEVVGATIVTIPTDRLMAAASGRALRILVWMTVLAAILLVLTNVIVEYALLRPLREMSAVAGRVSRGGFAEPELSVPEGNELSPLAASFTRMRRSLESSFRMLDE